MLASIQHTITRWELDRDLHKVLVAVSGGADSIALLHALDALWTPRGISLVVAHVHHGIRAEAAEADAGFVAESARCRGLPFLLQRVDVPAETAATGESLEMAARRLRGGVLRHLARTEGAGAICTGHTADDQLETLWLRLARGTGPRGLGGMAPHAVRREDPPTLRPLLECRRASLREWLRREGVAWREDASNEDPTIPRNRVRQTLLPVFEEAMGDSAAGNTLRTLDLLRDEERLWLEPLTREHLRQVLLPQSPDRGVVSAIDCGALRSLPRPLVRRVLLAWLQQQEFPPERQTLAQLENLAELSLAPPRGTRDLSLGDGWTARRTYQTLQLERELSPQPALAACRIAVPGLTPMPAWNLEAEVRTAAGFVTPARQHPCALPQSAWLCASAVVGRPLVLRAVEPGDRMTPIGALGSRKISDILVDRKIPRVQRRQIPVLLCGDAVAWLPGHSVDARFAVPDGQSDSLHITLRPLPPRGGFSLVETLIALALVGLVLVPSVLAMHRLLAAEQRLEHTLRAELSVRQVLEESALQSLRTPGGIAETRTFYPDAQNLRIVVRHRRTSPGNPPQVSVEAAALENLSIPVRTLSRTLPSSALPFNKGSAP